MIARALLALIRGYQLALSPLLGPRCRFSPTCSSYAARAIAVHGAARGSWLAVRRVARCHPFHPGGFDPVPLPGDRPARRSATMDPADAPAPDLAPAAEAPAPAPAHSRAHHDPARPATRPGPGG